MMLPSTDPRSAATSNNRKRRSRLQQPVRNIPTHIVTHWTKSRLVILATGVFCLATLSVIPILLLESLEEDANNNQGMHSSHVSVHSLLNIAQKRFGSHHSSPSVLTAAGEIAVTVPTSTTASSTTSTTATATSSTTTPITPTTKKARPIPSLSELDPDIGFESKPVARGVAGRPLVSTPSMVGAVRAHIECPDLSVDSLAYWNDPVGNKDVAFQSPFAVPNDDSDKQERYISFSPDRGGWNNVRMSMEIIFVLAAVTGRTLVLPPKEPLYLLHHDTASRHRGFADFFPLHTAAFQKRIKVISFVEFLEKEGGPTGRVPVPAENYTDVMNAADHCDHRKKSSGFCGPVFDYLDAVGYYPDMEAGRTCLVFDNDEYRGKRPSDEMQAQIKDTCGEKRTVMYWHESMNDHVLLHVRAGEKRFRLLTHFYGMMHFTDPVVDNYYRRFVRDFLHYHDSIYCAAGKVVKAVQAEGVARGFAVDAGGAGAYSALHVRRGDLQYKKVKIPAQEWYDNTKEVWLPNELLYVATDERNKTFFDDLAVHHDLRFLDDYWELAGLGDLDPNYMGMIDTIVASRGRAFAGTWFSTFTGYINRLRGYHGLSMKDSWYSFLPKKTAVQQWNATREFAYAYEWPDGWIGIDADIWPTREVF